MQHNEFAPEDSRKALQILSIGSTIAKINIRHSHNAHYCSQNEQPSPSPPVLIWSPNHNRWAVFQMTQHHIHSGVGQMQRNAKENEKTAKTNNADTQKYFVRDTHAHFRVS